MHHPEINTIMAREQYQDHLRRAERTGINRQSMPTRISLLQYTARGLGHVLFKLSLGLLRYGRAEATMFIPANQPSIETP